MKRISCLVICGLFLTALTNAQTNGTTPTKQYVDIPEPHAGFIQAFCNTVKNADFDPTGGEKFIYLYERLIWEMSGADHEESLDEAKPKIQKMWEKHGDKLLCTDADTAGRTVSVVIRSTQSNFPEFVFDLINKYELDIETRVNGENVFDYIDRRVKKLRAMGGQQERIRALEAMKKDFREMIDEKKKAKASEKSKSN